MFSDFYYHLITAKENMVFWGEPGPKSWRSPWEQNFTSTCVIIQSCCIGWAFVLSAHTCMICMCVYVPVITKRRSFNTPELSEESKHSSLSKEKPLKKTNLHMVKTTPPEIEHQLKPTGSFCFNLSKLFCSYGDLCRESGNFPPRKKRSTWWSFV